MANLTDYLEAKLLDHVLRAVVYTPPPAVYCGLITSAATASQLETGAVTNEVAGGSYARQPMGFDAATTPGGSSESSAQVTYTDMPAGVVGYAALFDAATGGNMLIWAPLLAEKTLDVGDAFVFLATEFTVTFG